MRYTNRRILYFTFFTSFTCCTAVRDYYLYQLIQVRKPIINWKVSKLIQITNRWAGTRPRGGDRNAGSDLEFSVVGRISDRRSRAQQLGSVWSPSLCFDRMDLLRHSP